MTALGPLIGGNILMSLPHDIGTLLGEPILRFHAVFVGSLALCWLATHALQQMQEPAERSVAELVRVMRRMREFNPVLGLVALAEMVFTPRRLTLFASDSLRSLRRQTADIADIGEELAGASLGALRRRLLPRRKSPPDRPS
jgi:hypothetical protein